jgi:hypothetical protein
VKHSVPGGLPTVKVLNLAAFVESIFPYSGRIMVGVFLSHSSKDKPFVRDLANALEAGGEIKVWLDEREIDYGQNIMLKIAEDRPARYRSASQGKAYITLSP